MSKSYTIFLDDLKFGTTKLEKADAPMGVVTGKIDFIDNKIGYVFFKEYCSKNEIKLNVDLPNDKFIDTQVIPNLKVHFEVNKEIIGHCGIYITGFDSEEYEITILGIPYPFFEDEFPHHVKEYENMGK